MTDCSAIQLGGNTADGVYTIYPKGHDNPLTVFCDLKTNGGGWTVSSKILSDFVHVRRELELTCLVEKSFSNNYLPKVERACVRACETLNMKENQGF